MITLVAIINLKRAYLRGGNYNYNIKNLTAALEGSLKRLKTEYIDLYQLHWPERTTNMFGKLGYQHEEKNDWNQFEDILGNLQKFIDQGKIRYIGLSNETPWGVSKCLELAKHNKLPRMMSIQNPYSLLNRTFPIVGEMVELEPIKDFLLFNKLALNVLELVKK